MEHSDYPALYQAAEDASMGGQNTYKRLVQADLALVVAGALLGALAFLVPTAPPVSIDPYVVASGHETVFEGSQIEGALSRRRGQTQGGGRQNLLGVDAHHKALAKKASRDRGCRARADPRQAL